jgi:transcriptional regulator with XRE-family HTH domain
LTVDQSIVRPRAATFLTADGRLDFSAFTEELAPPRPVIHRLGFTIRDLRQFIGITQRELGAKSGVAQGTISRIEQGRALELIGLRLAIQIAGGLGLPLDALVDGWTWLPGEARDRGRWMIGGEVLAPNPGRDNRLEPIGVRSAVARWLGGRLRHTRRERHLTRPEVCDRAGIGRLRLEVFEAGQGPRCLPNLDLAVKLAVVYETDLDTMVAGAHWNRRTRRIEVDGA